MTFEAFSLIILLWDFIPIGTLCAILSIMQAIVQQQRKERFVMSGITRKEAREQVVALLFETEFKADESSAEVFSISSENREIPEDEYIKRTYFGVCDNREKIDERIGAHSHGWKTHRLTKLSRSILRLAV